ncbi:hypothetical protein [Streptomyces sp. H27-D2]|uniref:hypothetical protein n=1 Tax=Streptomyces sp. H27-D2 TaxID=3046304 RepID=UPI002DBD0868|nr:hypothetical protein [Streptomyces sp. H27-D2]MEC4017510.1 hypothetical protein [Streptomyces sp. H27-D2]
MRIRRIAAAAALLGALSVFGTLTGCGIASTDVIDAGEPASGVQPPGRAANGVQLYFRSPTGLRPVTRSSVVSVGPEKAVEMLRGGPNGAERKRGLTTEVPPMKGVVNTTVRENRVDIFIPTSAADLSDAAVSQFTCTAANADVPGRNPAAKVDVRISGIGFRLGPQRCDGSDAFPAASPIPSARSAR